MAKAELKAKTPSEQGSFELYLENSKILRALIETLAKIIQETEIRVTPSKLEISAMDASRICLLRFTMDRAHFDDFTCEKEARIGVNLEDFEKILKRSSTSDTITLSYTPDEQKIRVKLKRIEATRTRTFTLAILDLDHEEVPLENLLAIEYPSQWEMDIDLFIEALKDAEIYSEILSITPQPEEGLTFASVGQIGEMEYTLGMEAFLSAELSDEGTTNYSILFLKAITKLSPITEKLVFYNKKDHPLKMDFSLLEGPELKYFLAPRVEETQFEEDVDELE